MERRSRPTPQERRRDERRVKTLAFRWPERREGFDRRGTHPVTGFLRENVVALAMLLVALNALNLFDLAMTYRALSAGAVEGNPVMREALAGGPIVAASFKIGLVVAATAGILLLRRYRRALQAAVAVTIAYGLLAGYHVVGPLVAI